MSKRTKRPYRKSTPVGRLRRNADKVCQHASLLRSRAASWGAGDERVAAVERLAGSVVAKAREIDGHLASLEESGFTPPEKQRSVNWEVGQMVAVSPKFRAKYEAAFPDELKRDPGYLDELVVENVPPSGEVVVRRRGRRPFLVPKTHLVECGGDGGG